METNKNMIHSITTMAKLTGGQKMRKALLSEVALLVENYEKINEKKIVFDYYSKEIDDVALMVSYNTGLALKTAKKYIDQFLSLRKMGIYQREEIDAETKPEEYSIKDDPDDPPSCFDAEEYAAILVKGNLEKVEKVISDE